MAWGLGGGGPVGGGAFGGAAGIRLPREAALTMGPTPSSTDSSASAPDAILATPLTACSFCRAAIVAADGGGGL